VERDDLRKIASDISGETVMKAASVEPMTDEEYRELMRLIIHELQEASL
jgi:hypothetical protein